ncbi:MAG: TonB-dependent receptor [Prolixibacteraceae bacterium]|nr:TonB-dependent receptor [Prolixibacteraceae bacterium]
MKLRYILFSMLALVSMFVVELQAQEQVLSTISGIVTDTNKQPVSGMTVEVQERGTETKTDVEGRFQILAEKGDVLVFVKEGYLTTYQDIKNVKESLAIHATQTIAEAGENDNVFIPFDVRKKREVNGAISTLKGSGFSQLPMSSLNNLLSGQAPGLNVWQTGTQPGRDEAIIVIRNRASFAGSNVPLILVDGVARDFPDMDLNEIESITVLKDAASLAWYGSRGANGVLLVTTKRGSAEKTRFTYDTQIGMQMPTTLTKPLDSYTFGTLYNQALQNDGFPALYSPETLENYKSGVDPYSYPNNNFVREFIKDNSMVQRHVLTASGGSRAIRYFTALSFFDQNGLFNDAKTPLFNTNVGYQRYNLRTNLDIQVTPMLNVQLDMGGRVEDRREPGSFGSSSFLSTVFTTPANAFPLLNENGSYGGTSLFSNNPLAMLKSRGYSSEITRVLLGTMNVNHKLDFILKGLSANLFYTFDIQGRFTSGRSQTYEIYQRNTDGSLTRFGTKTPLGYLSSAFADNVRGNELWTGFDYKNSFGKHRVNGSIRYQQAVISAAPRFDDKRQGISARASYSYNYRYYADLVAGYTGTDNFMPGKQFGFFPAVALGWVISEENLLKDVSFIDYLKLRGSYGMAGNTSTGESNKFPYAYLYNATSGGYPFGTSFTFVAGGSERILPNQDITWEKAYKTDLGIEAKLLKNSISISANYFNEIRKDILTSPIRPSIIGIGSFNINDGETRLRGFEGMIDFTKKFGDFTLYLGGNFTSARNKILRINESAGLVDYQIQKGHNIGGVTNFGKLMLVSDGIFQSQTEIDNSPVQRFAGKVRPGDIKYKDINDDEVIDNFDRVMTDYKDTPDAYYGFKLGGMYKEFDFSVLMQGVSGRTIEIRSLVMAGSNSTGYINQFSVDAWSTLNPLAPYPGLRISDRANNTVDSDFWLRSGDYLRLKSVEVGYTIPAELTDKCKIRSLRVYLNGFNLLNFDNTGLDIDPEMPYAGYNSNYPYVRTITAGLNLKF